MSLPALQVRKDLLELCAGGFERRAGDLAGHDGGAFLEHLLHRAVGDKGAVLVAVDAVVLAGRAVGVGAQQLGCGERHRAGLAEFNVVFHD